MDIFEYDIQSIVLLVQVALDIILLLVIFSLYKKLGAIDMARIEHIKQELAEAEKRSLEMEGQLRDKEKRLRGLEDTLALAISKENQDAFITEASSSSFTSNEPLFEKALSQKMFDGDMHATVLNLWEKGRTIPEIARATGMPDGEVEVIVSIAKTARSD